MWYSTARKIRNPVLTRSVVVQNVNKCQISSNRAVSASTSSGGPESRAESWDLKIRSTIQRAFKLGPLHWEAVWLGRAAAKMHTWYTSVHWVHWVHWTTLDHTGPHWTTPDYTGLHRTTLEYTGLHSTQFDKLRHNLYNKVTCECVCLSP